MRIKEFEAYFYKIKICSVFSDFMLVLMKVSRSSRIEVDKN